MPNRLSEYRRKREFSATPEPQGRHDGGAAAAQRRYVIHLHHARSRHFDLRLQVGDTLRSWAVPKGPSLDPQRKRLAVQVEDHPLDYAGFEGTIPQGHYGAGDVWIWDEGRWTPEGDPRKDLAAGHLRFKLEGRRLHGAWSLVRTRLSGRQPQWLLIKSRDAAARAGDEADDTPLSRWQRSARVPASAPSAAQAIAPGSAATPKRARRSAVPKASAPPRAAPRAAVHEAIARPTRSKAASRPAAPRLSLRPASRKAVPSPVLKAAGEKRPLPHDAGLQLARPAERAPAGRDWLHEVKFDGYRVLLWRNGGSVRATSRGDQDWSGKLGAVVRAVGALPCDSCILDGELVAVDCDGRSSFGRLQRQFGENADGLTVMIFDLLYLDGRDCRRLPQLQRKTLLSALMRNAEAPLQLTDYLLGDGPAAARGACANGLEGIISKQADAPYEEGRGGAWLKIKCVQSEEYAVIGYTTGRGARSKLGSLLLGRPGAAAQDPWRYVGRVGSGLDDVLIGALLQRLVRTGRPVPLMNPPQRAQLRGATPLWVTPQLVVEVQFRGFTADQLLRQASLKGTREDRTVASLRPGQRDRAVASAGATAASSPRPAPRRAAMGDGSAPPLRRSPAGGATAGARARSPAPAPRGAAAAAATTPDESSAPASGAPAVRLTHPERVLFETPPITKRQLADFYRDIADFILPGLVGRPLLLMRRPNGVGAECFFQKHLSPGFPRAVHEVADPVDKVRWMYIDDLEGLLSLVQMSAVEYHVWGATVADLDRADRLVFDLDPAADVPWKQVVHTALQLRQRLEAVNLQSFVRTTGGKGLHVVVPLNPPHGWDVARHFAHAVAETMAREQPEHYLAVATKARRGGRIFIDYLRNGRGATAVASYSLRERPQTPIAVPLEWQELPRVRSAQQFGYANIRRRLERLPRDPWHGIGTLQQSLPDS